LGKLSILAYGDVINIFLTLDSVLPEFETKSFMAIKLEGPIFLISSMSRYRKKIKIHEKRK